MEHITFEELYQAYKECERHKRDTESYSQFAISEYSNLSILLRDLNNQTYEIGDSIRFVVTRPKLREVYAADFRDRIVHHLVIRKFNSLFEDLFIPSTYNCRKGKGVLYGVYDMSDKLDRITNHYTSEAWVWKADLKNFFMSIDRAKLFRMLKSFLSKKYDGEDLDWWLWLIKKIVMHDPENHYILKGDPKLFEELADEKKLGYKKDRGEAIGNLPSQIFANFFLSMLDYLLYYWHDNEYGRYVDDFADGNISREFLLDMMPRVRRFLRFWLDVELHPNKWSLQQASKGLKFTGYVLKQGRIYVGNNTVNNAFRVARHGDSGNLRKFTARMNSYLGFMVHCNSYAIRRNLWKAIPLATQKKIFITNNFSKIVIRKSYENYHQSPRQDKMETNGIQGRWELLFAGHSQRKRRLHHRNRGGSNAQTFNG